MAFRTKSRRDKGAKSLPRGFATRGLVDQANIFEFSFSLNPASLCNNSPGLLAAKRHLPRPPREDEEGSRGSAPLAKDDTDATRLLLLRRGAAVVGGVGVGANAPFLPPLVLAWPPRAAEPPELREAQVVVVAARIVEKEPRV